MQNDMDYVGFAPVERFENAPEEHRPWDLLPGAKTVVSMSIKMFKGAQVAMIRGFNHPELRHVMFSYRWFAYGLSNLLFMDRAALLVVRLLEEEGHVAMPIAASGVGYSKNNLQNFSNRHAGVAAGLAEFGWNGLALTPENGPRQRFVSVLTTAKLDADPMYEGPKLCDLKKCMELGAGVPLCVKSCPMQAFLSQGKKEVVIGGKRMEYAKLNFKACNKIHDKVSDTETPDYSKIDSSGQEGVLVQNLQLEPRFELERMVFRRGHGCGFCLFSCPVGAPKEIKDIMDPEIKARLSWT